MKFLKSQNTSRYSPSDNALQINSYGRAVMDINGALMIPKGTTAQRPDITGVRQPADGETLSTRIPNGYIRFNVDTDSFEGYINGTWEVIKGSGSTSITKQTLGPGDDIETDFGPLSVVPANDNNILVFVENVFQFSVDNFNIDYDYSGTGQAYIIFTSPVPSTKNITIYYGFV